MTKEAFSVVKLLVGEAFSDSEPEICAGGEESPTESPVMRNHRWCGSREEKESTAMTSNFVLG